MAEKSVESINTQVNELQVFTVVGRLYLHNQALQEERQFLHAELDRRAEYLNRVLTRESLLAAKLESMGVKIEDVLPPGEVPILQPEKNGNGLDQHGQEG